MNKIGLARGMFYYYYKDIWEYFFDFLNIDYVVSPRTDNFIIRLGDDIAESEMCLSLKIYLGHVKWLEGKCEYLLIPRIDNFNLDNQTCTNFLSVYDIVSNLFDFKLLDYNICLSSRDTLKKGLVSIGQRLGKTKKECFNAYKYAIDKYLNKRMRDVSLNMNKLNSSKLKVLIVSHPYNIYDNFIGKEIINYLSKNDVMIVYSDLFDKVNHLSKIISPDLYFKYSKDNLGALVYCEDKVDGIIFLSSFPCGPDSLANEMAFRWVDKPYINLVVDLNTAFVGIETRLESFLDVLKGEKL